MDSSLLMRILFIFSERGSHSPQGEVANPLASPTRSSSAGVHHNTCSISRSSISAEEGFAGSTDSWPRVLEH